MSNVIDTSHFDMTNAPFDMPIIRIVNDDTWIFPISIKGKGLLQDGTIDDFLFFRDFYSGYRYAFQLNNETPIKVFNFN